MSALRPLLLAFGNDLRGDDGAGPFAAWLVQQADAARSWDVIICHQLSPELAETLAGASLAVFVDADAAVAPGEIRTVRLDPGILPADPGIILHHFDPAALLMLSQRLYGRAPEAWLAGIGAASFELSETLSPGTEQGARKAADFILSLAQ
jgi:hydrogenase maturation protease